MPKMTPRTLSGFMELLPAPQQQMERMMDILRHTYALYGFTPLDTPVIEASEVPASDVVLELTESVLIDPRDEVDAALRSLRAAGVVLALDDFGAGYSGLTYLRRYPLDILKLDISYTQAMVHDNETRVIVDSLIEIATRLGQRVVAEGVETPEQLELVKSLGITWAQGYLVGRPAPIEELIASGLPPYPGIAGLVGQG